MYAKGLNMKYQSTMGGVCGLTFKQALYTGFAVDGGMLLPESIPALSPETLRAWAGLPYKELVKNIVALYVEDEIPEQDLNCKTTQWSTCMHVLVFGGTQQLCSTLAAMLNWPSTSTYPPPPLQDLFLNMEPP